MVFTQAYHGLPMYEPFSQHGPKIQAMLFSPSLLKPVNDMKQNMILASLNAFILATFGMSLIDCIFIVILFLKFWPIRSLCTRKVPLRIHEICMIMRML